MSHVPPDDPTQPNPDPSQNPDPSRNPGPYQSPGPSQPPPEQPGYWQQQAPGYPPPYGQQPGYPTGQVRYAPDHPRATMALVLGILGLVVCGVVAPFAWVIGARAVREIDESNGGLGGRGAAKAGYILGIIGTVLLGLGILALGVLVVFGLLTASTTTGMS
jgi:hypothetical protein